MTTDPDILVEARTALNDIVNQTPIAPEWEELDAGLQRLDQGRPPRRWSGPAVALVAAAAALVTIGAIGLVGSSQAPRDVAGNPVAPQETTETFDLARGTDPESGSSVALVERDGLVLTLRGPLDRQCLDVTSEAGMSGGCGLDLSLPLSLAAGGLDGTNFISGWAPETALRVVVTLAGGVEIEVTDLVAVEGINRRFFMELIPPTAAGDVNASGELNLPITAVALDQSDQEVGRFVLDGGGTS